MTSSDPFPSDRPAVSCVVVVHDMERELPRTLETFRRQRGIDLDRLEVVVVDNGSPVPVPARFLDGLPRSRLLRIDPAPPSPVRAANLGVATATAELIGLFIDGARMLSPGLVATARRADALASRPVIATVGFHLGAVPHMRAAEVGHDQSTEDDLLAGVDWRADGYRLFGISTFAGSSGRGWFGPMGESNGLFLPRGLWDELGGLDEAFDLPGGGLANHDLYHRACTAPGTELVVLLGEATFHQYHGGAATGGPRDPAPWDQYARLRGHPYRPPAATPTYVGRMGPELVGPLRRSLDWLERETDRRRAPG